MSTVKKTDAADILSTVNNTMCTACLSGIWERPATDDLDLKFLERNKGVRASGMSTYFGGSVSWEDVGLKFGGVRRTLNTKVGIKKQQSDEELVH